MTRRRSVAGWMRLRGAGAGHRRKHDSRRCDGRWRPLLAAAAVGAAAFVATGSASPSDPSNLANVAAANTKTPGVSSPNVLSVGLTEAPVAQGANPLENGTQQVPFYGYDGNGSLLPVFPSWTEATKTEPDKNTYLAHQRPEGRRPELRLRQPLPLPGPRGRDPGLPHAHQPRRRRRAPRDPAGDPGQQRRRPARHRRLHVGPVGAAPALHRGGLEGWRRLAGHARRARRRSTASRDSSGRAATRASRTTPTATSGSSRTPAVRNGTANPHAKQPNSFVFRFKPYDRADLTKGGKLQALQVTSLRSGQPIAFHAGQADADIKSDDTQGPAHLRPLLRDAVGDHPRHRDRRHGAVLRQRGRQGAAGDAVQASGERAVPARHAVSARSSSTRPVTPTTAREAGARLRRLRRRPAPRPEQPVGRPRHGCACSTRAIRPTAASTT